MEIECTQENLAKALSQVGRMVGTRGTLPVLGNILLKTEKGRLRLAATDLEVGVQMWVGGKVTKDGTLTIPARLMIDFVTTNTDPTIFLSTEGTTLHLKSDHFSANIKGIDANEFPLMPEVKAIYEVTVLVSEFREAIQQTVFATAIDETRPVLTGVLFKATESQTRLVATDSYRLAERSFKVRGKQPIFSVIVPARTLQEVQRMLHDTLETMQIVIGESQILFRFGETEFISRLIDGIFPDYEQIIPKQTTTTIDLERQNFSQVMKMASFFARESANNVQVKVQAGKGIEVTAISPQLGDTTSQLPGQVQGEALEIAFNAKFILDALAVFPSDEIQLELSGKLQPGVLRPKGRKDYLYLLMPLRIDV